MSANAMPRPSVDYPKAIWESASSLSESAQSAAIRKVRELGFDENQGEIPLEETLINLSLIRDVLLDTVEKGKLTQLPLRLQSRLLQESNRIGQGLADLVNGKDTVRALENSVEELNATIYQLNLQNQSESILGFERKMNELKAEEVIVRRSMGRATRLEKKLEEVETLLGGLHALVRDSDQASSLIRTSATDADGLREEISELEIKARTALTIIGEYQDAISKSSALAKEVSAEIAELRTSSQADRDEIADLRITHTELTKDMEELKRVTSEAVDERLTALEQAGATLESRITEAADDFTLKLEGGLATHLAASTEKADDLISDADMKLAKLLKTSQAEENGRASAFQELAKNVNETSDRILQGHAAETDEIIARLRKIEEQIDGAVLRATGFTLFHSFQKRQEDLQKSARVWAIVLGCCLICSAGAAVLFLFFLKYFPSTGPAIYFKASLSLPFMAAILFSGWQYTRERRLEEEYAFKSNISISLKPYQELVDGLVDKDNPEECAKYTAFIISSINKVFTSPTGLVFDTESMPGDEAKELLKATISGAKDIIKAKSGS